MSFRLINTNVDLDKVNETQIVNKGTLPLSLTVSYSPYLPLY